MADYKRIVSYLYKYERGKKGANAGYVRIEVRQGNLKLLIHAQDSRALKDKDFAVYFYYYHGENLKGIQGGIMRFHQGESEFKKETKDYAVFDSKLSLDEISGVLIYYNSDLAYGTQWDDKPIQIERFESDETQSQNVQNQEKTEKVLSEPLKNELFVDENHQQILHKKEIVTEETRLNDTKEEPAVKEERITNGKPEEGFSMEEAIENIVQEKAPVKEERITNGKAEEGFSMEEAIENIAQEKPLESRNVRTKHLQTELLEKNEELKIDKRINSLNLEPAEAKKLEMESQVLLKDLSAVNPEENESNILDIAGLSIDNETFLGLQAIYQSDILEPAEISNQQQEEKVKIQKEAARFQSVAESQKLLDQLLNTQARISHPANRDILIMVRIHPQDLGRLSISNWYLGSNSFLIHGFYQFHYITVGKLLNGDGTVRGVIGVPGIYNNQERYMAAQFGFREFVPVKPAEIKTGSFGYWVINTI